MLMLRALKISLKLAKKLGIKVVYASSSSVYGNPISIPIKENQISKNPFNPYAKTKLEDDKLAEKYAKNGLKVIGLRYFNVFGKGQSKEYAGVIKLFLERIQHKLPPLINGDGLQVRDFVYVERCCKRKHISDGRVILIVSFLILVPIVWYLFLI